MEESRQKMVSSSSVSYDDKAMSLMGGDVCSHCAQASKGWGGGLLSVCMNEGFNNGVMVGFQHYDGILVVFRLSK